MQVIPVIAVPSQTLTVQLDGQNTLLNIYQKAYGLFMDIYVDNVLVVGGCICQNQNKVIRSLYLGFEGDLCFIDTQGSTDPVYTGLGTRYSLIYLEASDLPANVG